MNKLDEKSQNSWTRRRFLEGTLAIAASSPFASSIASGAEPTPVTDPKEFHRKIKLGIIGNGERGAWIANLFKGHGGFEMHAVADYFPEVAYACGEAVGVDKARRFSTLSGHRRLIESGVEAVAVLTPPYFIPDYAHAAVEAGLHVYMAKPIAVDVPGCLRILEAAKIAEKKQLTVLVDYQMPTDPANIEVVKRIRDASFGPIAQIQSTGTSTGFPDPKKTANLESRLQHLIWVNDIALGCDYIGNFDIHAIDAALWAAGQRPIAAMGRSRVFRTNPTGDSHDVCSVVFEYHDGLVHNHFGQSLRNQAKTELSCTISSGTGTALLTYWGTARFRTADDGYSKEVVNLYEAGAMRNIAAFYRNIVSGKSQTDTVERSVDGVLTCILGRDAAAEDGRLTMKKLLEQNRKLEVDLRGLKT